MNSMGPIVVCHANATEAQDILAERFANERLHYIDSPDLLAGALTDIQPEIAFTLKSDGMPGPNLRQVMRCPSMRWVYVGGSGYDHLLPLDNPSITVSNAAGVLASHLAENVTGAMLALNGNFLRYAAQQRDKRWQSLCFAPLAEQTLLVVGLGQIGAKVAANAKHLGMRVLATRRTANPHPEVDEVLTTEALPVLLPRADFVSLHVRLEPQTQHLFSDDAFSRMRRGAFFINTSRGPIVDESALLRALDSGQVGGAYLDVFEQEPLPSASHLWHQPNVLITPHAADNILGWQRQFLQHFADNLDSYRAGQAIANVVHRTA
jgi:phosphoglycerate dehydrogenase-like enzyme